jgi:hypothetical protein
VAAYTKQRSALMLQAVVSHLQTLWSSPLGCALPLLLLLLALLFPLLLPVTPLLLRLLPLYLPLLRPLLPHLLSLLIPLPPPLLCLPPLLLPLLLALAPHLLSLLPSLCKLPLLLLPLRIQLLPLLLRCLCWQPLGWLRGVELAVACWVVAVLVVVVACDALAAVPAGNDATEWMVGHCTVAAPASAAAGTDQDRLTAAQQHKGIGTLCKDNDRVSTLLFCYLQTNNDAGWQTDTIM